MFFTQIVNMPEIHLVAVADLDVPKAQEALKRTGWENGRIDAPDVKTAVASGATTVVDDALTVIHAAEIEVVLEITGNPIAGASHALAAIEHGKHVIMVNVEADCLIGPILHERALSAGVVYSMAYGDQPALICELVDWCRTVGYELIAAGKGTKYLPEYRASTPDTVWDFYGLSERQIESGDFNPKMFNSFLDGTKSAIEMAAVSNATGLSAPVDGLAFPPSSVDDLASVMRPASDGGALSAVGQVEVVSSLRRDGTEIDRNLRWGVYVAFRAKTEYAARCFGEYGVVTDPSGEFATLYRPYHMIGMELGVSVASAVLRGESTGSAKRFNADVVAVAKKDLSPGERLDGEGGYCVVGSITTAEASLRAAALPIGLAHDVKVIRDVKAGDVVTWDDVNEPQPSTALSLRRELESAALPHTQ